jgi:hypothetical protein
VSRPRPGPRPESCKRPPSTRLRTPAATILEFTASLPEIKMSTTIRAATFDDYADVCDLMQRYGLGTKALEEWKHLWECNPVLIRRTEPLPLGWALENNGKLVGFLGNIPTFCSLAGRRLLVTTANHWVVDEPYRSHSIALLKRYLGQKEIDLFLNTTAGSASGKVWEALGAKRMPLASYENVLFWITAPREVVRALLIRKNIPAAGALSFPLGLALRIGLLLGRTKIAKGQGVREIASFDSRFDVFWNELKQGSTKLLSWRDAETLNWHFKYALAAKRARILILEAGGRITAYAVLCRTDKPDLSLKRYHLADFQCLDNSETQRACAALLGHGLELCRKEGVHVLEAVGFTPEKRAVLESFAPLGRKTEAWPFYFKSRHADIETALSAAAVWDPSIYDGDGSL